VSTALSAPQQYPTPQPSPESQDWKQLLAERIEAHRAKSGGQAPPSAPATRVTSPASRSSHIARAVASRYAAQPTYSEVLAAADAERAAQEQAAEEELWAEQAAMRREQIADQEPEYPAEAAAEQHVGMGMPLFASQEAERDMADRYASPIRTVPGATMLPGAAGMPKFAERAREMRLHQTPQEVEPTLEELLASSTVEPRSLLPSKLIEFPRELVSAHKSRPRLPDEPHPVVPPEITELEAMQLRIFEVQPEVEAPAASESQSAGVGEQGTTAAAAVATAPVRETVRRQESEPSSERAKALAALLASDAGASSVRTFKGLEWAAISLDKEPAAYARKRVTEISDHMPLLIEPASIDRRVMAFAVDFAFVTAAFLGFLTIFAAATPRLPSGLPAILMAGAVYVALWLLYQMLFFSLSGATAGMLYARIALCTFNDQNPSRSALRRRLAAWWLSCLPLGLGFFWSFLDEDNLSWHDRMTGMYQRTY
jgi:uncharacterized RDD family membrane protein YckC